MSSPLEVAPGREASGVTVPRGFRASGLHCGIRRKRPDLAIIAAERSVPVAAVFTTNLVQAAPVVLSRRHLERAAGRARAIVVNAGNANACTGPQGDEAARRTAELAARCLGVRPEDVLVASTGVIGEQLPVDRLLDALPRAIDELSTSGGHDAAEAILTTDTCTKESVRFAPSGFSVGGVAKGSGMIHPNMATTLAFVTTDARVEPDLLHECLVAAVDRSFHRITVDGDTSTNDMVAIMASGESGVPVDRRDSVTAHELREALEAVLVDLARAVVRDGEGATKLITVRVTGGRTEDEALAVARTIASSPLVKTAVHGEDANWGRIVAAAGRAGVPIEPERMTVSIGDAVILGPGYERRGGDAQAAPHLAADEVVLGVDLGRGRGEATTWTCDLTHGYVDINASYRS